MNKRNFTLYLDEKKFENLKYADFYEIYNAIMKNETYRNKAFIFNLLAKGKKKTLYAVLNELNLKDEDFLYTSWFNFVNTRLNTIGKVFGLD